jgi:hypothetical protein
MLIPVRDVLPISELTRQSKAIEGCYLYIRPVGKRFQLLVVEEDGAGCGQVKLTRFIPVVYEGEDE